ncbi:MAG TPA: helix-turn-helix transcriptional regulator [Polyangiaceae bacterium]|nr:helix-turn-helix transcriptional regulator [Polyangiaceae bacterium]
MSIDTLDLLHIVEAAYDMDASDEAWLQRIAELVRPLLDDGFGLAAFTFTREPDQPPEMQTSLHLWMPEPLAAVYPRLFKNMDPALRQRPFQLGPCVTGSQMMNMKQEFAELPAMKAGVQRFGMFDSMWITATDPSGVGCGFHAGRREIAWATPLELERWGRIAAHLTSAVRIRLRLRANGTKTEPSAVFDPNGVLEHAEGAAKTPEAREALRQAVVTMERARGAERRENPDRALGQWRALVDGQWSLVDQIEVDGRRYVVARENEPRASGLEALTERERQVVGYAQLGHHNKLIAYELGIAHSTVRVLISRAAAKLGARTREELLRTTKTTSP